MMSIKIGDYVLAIKWTDGDPCDPFGVGYVTDIRYEKFFVNNIGHRRAEVVTLEEGSALVAMFLKISDIPGDSLWTHLARLRGQPVEEQKTSEETIAALTTELTKLRAEHITFRNAQKACEDCDAPTMAEVTKLRALVDAAWFISFNPFSDHSINKSLDPANNDFIWTANDAGNDIGTFATALEAFEALREK